MSLVNYYKCDICDKEFKKDELRHFTKKHTYISCFEKVIDTVKDFDMCEKCFARIVKEIRGVE